MNNKPDTEEFSKKAMKLFALCEKFIEDNEISCAETVSQTDRVIENAYDFIVDICEIVGYDQRQE